MSSELCLMNLGFKMRPALCSGLSLLFKSNTAHIHLLWPSFPSVAPSPETLRGPNGDRAGHRVSGRAINFKHGGPRRRGRRTEAASWTPGWAVPDCESETAGRTAEHNAASADGEHTSRLKRTKHTTEVKLWRSTDLNPPVILSLWSSSRRIHLQPETQRLSF